MPTTLNKSNAIEFNNARSPDISVKIAGVRFRNPVIAASGTFGYGKEYSNLLDVSALGGICTKGLTLHPRSGNAGIRLWETPSGLLNSIGLENPGIDQFIQKELPALRRIGPVVIANLSGGSIEEYTEGAAKLSDSAIDMIELNISCPNVRCGGMSFGLDPKAAKSVLAPVKKISAKPIIVKLSPNAPDINAVAKTCEDCGADAFSLVNTFKGMAIDIQTQKPVFDNVSAGLSGPAIRPIALRMVWELCEQTRLPVIGMGGIDSAETALEFLMAGAAAIEVGSATFANPPAMTNIIAGITNYMQTRNIANLSKLAIR
jgi:dihydroorotate dehydrogenase (NAD+) catalytic subunit